VQGKKIRDRETKEIRQRREDMSREREREREREDRE
jgi:hypothetical protein